MEVKKKVSPLEIGRKRITIKMFLTLTALLLLVLFSCSPEQPVETRVTEQQNDTLVADSAKKDQVSFTLEETKMEGEVYTDFSVTINNKVKELGERLGKFNSVDAADSELQDLVAQDASYVYKSKMDGIMTVIFLVENDTQVVVTELIKEDAQPITYNELLVMSKGK